MQKVIVSMRAAVIALIAVALTVTLADDSGLVPESYIDLASYYTFQTNIVCGVVLAVLLWHSVRRTAPGPWVEYGRAFVAVNLVVVGIIYWSTIFPLGTEHGPAMTWVMVISHIVTPLYLAVDYLLVGSRDPLPLSRWWIIAGYAAIWTVATVARSALGEWDAYEHLNPDRGYAEVLSVVALHSLIMLALTLAGMRVRRFRTIPDPARSPAPLDAEGQEQQSVLTSRSAASR